MSTPPFKMIDEKLQGWDKLVFRMIVHLAGEVRRDRQRSMAIGKSLLAISDFVRSQAESFPDDLVKNLEGLQELHAEHLDKSRESVDDFENLMAEVMAYVSAQGDSRDG